MKDHVMNRVLVHIEADHPQRIRSAVDEADRLYRQAPCEVVLLHVQRKVTGHVAMYFEGPVLHELLMDWGQQSLEPAHRQLLAAGVPHTCIVRIGQSAPTIAAVARELGCSHIVFGVEDAGLAQRLFGSMAQQVRHIFQAPGGPQILGT